MPDRQKFCVAIMSLLILLSAAYLAYYLFLHKDCDLIQDHNKLRLQLFLAQHLFAILMLLRLLAEHETDQVVKWMFQLSTGTIFSFGCGEAYIVAKGGRLFGSKLPDYGQIHDTSEAILQFQVNEVSLYFQIMTDFVMFFVVSSVALAILKCRDAQTEQSYEFMVDNLKSQEYVDEPDAAQKKACSICLTDLDQERVYKLPCEHVFHKDCLVNWLKRSTVCPLCRTDIEQSLAPNSPQRYPPVPYQPILLQSPPPALPSMPSNTLPPSNPLIQPRPVISLRNVTRNTNNSTNTNNNNFVANLPNLSETLEQPHQIRRNINNARLPSNNINTPEGNEHAFFSNPYNTPSARMGGRKVMGQNRQNFNQLALPISQRKNCAESLPSICRAVTERKKQQSFVNMHHRHPSSPHLHQQQEFYPKQTTNNQGQKQQRIIFKQPSLAGLQPSQPYSKSPQTYPNPNQKLSTLDFQDNKQCHIMQRNSTVQLQML